MSRELQRAVLAQPDCNTDLGIVAGRGNHNHRVTFHAGREVHVLIAGSKLNIRANFKDAPNYCRSGYGEVFHPQSPIRVRLRKQAAAAERGHDQRIDYCSTRLHNENIPPTTGRCHRASSTPSHGSLVTPRTSRLVLSAFALLVIAAGCRSAVVIVPQPTRAYTATDTLWGYYKNNRVQVTFRFDTTYRTDTVTRTDTLYRGGTRTIIRRDTLLRRDTLYRVDTVVVGATGRIPTGTTTPTRPTTPVPVPTTRPRVDTVYRTRVDTVFRSGTVSRVDTIFRTRVDTLVRTNTVVRVDTVARIDTVFRTNTVVRVDTVRVGGHRMLFVPPGQYPPIGQCRVWIHDLPPGRQANAAPCIALGRIPAGAFILFGGEAYDFDYDWIAESRRSSVPPEIIALKR